MSSDENNMASVEELYLKEKKKATILMMSTLVLAVLLIGSVITRPDSSSAESSVAQNTQAGTQQQRGQGGRGAQSITTFFDESGAVDQAAVDALASRISQGGGPAGADPSQFLERFTQQIEAGVESGEITQAQGAELLAAFAQIESTEI